MNIQIEPLDDKILVKQFKPGEKTPGGIILPETSREGEQYGEITAVGPGAYLADGQFRAMDLKVGDEIAFGKYDGTEFEIDGRKFFVINRDRVIGRIRRG